MFNNPKYKEINQILKLLVDNQSSTRSIIGLLGKEDESITRNNRGSLFLIPKSNEYLSIALNPDLKEGEDKPIDFISLDFKNLIITISDLIQENDHFKVSYLPYDDNYYLSVTPINIPQLKSIVVDLGGNDEIVGKVTQNLKLYFNS